jgi:pyruvate,water dikinase
VPIEEQRKFSIGDDDILTLAGWAIQIEAYYTKKRGMPSPMDMEWGKDGRTGELFILQARP